MDLVASVDLDDDFRWCGGPHPELHWPTDQRRATRGHGEFTMV